MKCRHVRDFDYKGTHFSVLTTSIAERDLPSYKIMTVEVFDEEIMSRRVKASETLLKEFNELFKRASHDDKTLLEFMQTSCQFLPNPAMIHELDFPDDEVMQWASVAMFQAMDMLRKGENEFCTGSLGSIWFDAQLGGSSKVKQTRVCMRPEKAGGKFEIMLDATFEEKW